MAVCPKCGTTLKDEYGMSQCPGCGAFSFIDLDGNASETEPSQTPAPDESLDFGAPDHFDSLTPDHPPAGGAAAPPDFMDPIEEVLSVPPNDSSTDSFEPISMDPVEAEAPATNVGTPPSFGPASDPLNLNDFANSELSSAKDGPLLFRVLISGIDTKEIRESIREVLEDARFVWDAKAILSRIAKGQLTIDALSPVKASILITRIKYLPVSIRWEQYAITQGPPS